MLTLDIGPFASIIHAERYCDLMPGITYGLVGDCYVVQEYPGLESKTSFSSSAMVRYSATAVDEVISDTSVFDLPRCRQPDAHHQRRNNVGSRTRPSPPRSSRAASWLLTRRAHCHHASAELCSGRRIYRNGKTYRPDCTAHHSDRTGSLTPIPGAEAEKPQTAADILLNTDEN